MGSISDMTYDPYESNNKQAGFPPRDLTTDNGFKSFEIAGLVSSKASDSVCARDEVVLLSWLLVLLRTQESSHVRFDWTYQNHGQNGDTLSYQCLSTNEVVPTLQSTVREVALTIHKLVVRARTKHSASSYNPVSLVISTGCSSQPSEEMTAEGTTLCLELRWTTHMEVRPLWHSKDMPQHMITRYMETLIDTIRICITSPEISLEQCIGPTSFDLNEIWKLNHVLPPTYDLCMHDLISERAQTYQDKIAVSSWDGNLTYNEIDQYSTFVACRLVESGIRLHDVVPVCFEKSRWTIVALLAVMKAGATFVLMDPTLPLARLQNTALQVSAKSILTSRKQHDLSKTIVPDGKTFVVEQEKFAEPLSPSAKSMLPIVPSSALMYIIFTSGSTGTPKGVMISHTTYTSSAFPRAKAVGYTEESRVLDFASYAFDVSIDSMLLTVSQGGCLCIPSDEDRLNDLNGVIREMQINYAGLTPSVARILDEDIISSLSSLGLGGEAVTARDVARWGQNTRIVIGYGPCECTIGCTINSSAATGRDYISIGQGNGANIWIVDPDNYELLMPVGAVGELLVEGPIVGQGYLNDSDKTAESFINDPQWLLAGYESYAGRSGRLYKTGDLVRYDPDGSGGFIFVGRKDTQVKLRGQRVELGEIEWQLRTRLPTDTGVVAEVIAPAGAGGQPTLVSFISFKSLTSSNTSNLELVGLNGDLQEALSKAEGELSEVLPRYMVPTACIPVSHIPVLISGKTDRKILRQFGASIDLRRLDRSDASSSSILTGGISELERDLQQSWSQVLKLEAETVQSQDNFFALGGDSVTAMRLVSVCRERGYNITVADIFSHPSLSEMASVVTVLKKQDLFAIPAFSLIPESTDSIIRKASSACGVNSDIVEDVFPCTPTQESLFTFSIKSAKSYIAQRLARIPAHVTLDAWKSAWEEAVKASPILRTRIIQSQESGLQQVVIREPISWRYSCNLSLYLEQDQSDKMSLGQNLARYAIVEQPKENTRYMVWTIHHVVYDGWSEPLILKKVSDALQNEQSEAQAQMKNFVKYIRSQDEATMQNFWREELRGATGPQFPPLPYRDYMPTPDSMIEHEICLSKVKKLPFTMATIIRGAWSLVSSQYTLSDDVVLSETLTGRDISLAGVESIEGPLITTLPVRVRIHRGGTVQTYLQSIQQGISARVPYEHYGIQNIRRVSRDAQHACEARTGLVIQPEMTYSGGDLGFEEKDVLLEALHFNPYPLMLACGIRTDSIRVCASFDSSIVDVAQMKRILKQLETAVLNLTEDLTRYVKDISCLPQLELSQIWQWNRVPPLSMDGISKSLRAGADVKQGSNYPPAVVSWVCDSRNPSLLSPIGCVGELWIESNFLSAGDAESPSWLIAGSSRCPGRSGRVQPTGDLVQLREDGSLMFVGRKEAVSAVRGHTINLADVEAQFARHLPPTVRAVAAVRTIPSDDAQEVIQQEVVAFVTRQHLDEDEIDRLPTGPQALAAESDVQALPMSIDTSVSVKFARELKDLDMKIQDSLPPYMVPSAYIMVDELSKHEEIDRTQLNDTASKIPQQVLEQIRSSLHQAWAASSAQTEVTAAEKILRSSWGEVLMMNPELIDLDDNFFRLGGDSVMAMKLISNLRLQGHALTIADIFQHMRLRDAATVLKVAQAPEINNNTYHAFSTVEQSDTEKFLSEVVRPQLVDPSWVVQDVLPVTDSQALDIRATVAVPRTSVQYNMLYFNSGIDRMRLVRACNELVEAHPILRTVFVEHESTYLQVVLDSIDTHVPEFQTDQDINSYVGDICKSDIESDWQLGSLFFRFFHVVGSIGEDCLVLSLSHALYDGMSLPVLLRDLETLYRGDEIISSQPFDSYIAHVLDEGVQAKSLDYWQKLLAGSSLSVVPSAPKSTTERSIFRTRPVDISEHLREITTANLLTSAWALVLARSLQIPDVTFGSVSSGRHVNLVNVENVVGPCYQIMPIRIKFESHWTGMDLMRHVQSQTAQSAAHDFVGFEKISKECTQWSPTAKFFDSIVHHQDFEDFDTMPFADGTCRVEISNLHGDAAYPIKVVSFMRKEQMHVGVVGSEGNPAFVDKMLDELVRVVEGLANQSSRKVVVIDQAENLSDALVHV